MSTDEGRIKGLEIDGYLATLQNSLMSRLQAINWSFYFIGVRVCMNDARAVRGPQEIIAKETLRRERIRSLRMFALTLSQTG